MRRVIVIGGSAGSIDPLCEVIEELPADFSAPIMVVIHINEAENMLTDVLQRCTKLKVISPRESQPVMVGHVYIAPPNRHLVVRSDCVIPVPGPRENRHRPAIDVMFRSAARSYGARVVAVAQRPDLRLTAFHLL